MPELSGSHGQQVVTEKKSHEGRPIVCTDTGRSSAAQMQEVEQEIHEQVWFVEAGINERVN